MYSLLRDRIDEAFAGEPETKSDSSSTSLLSGAG
jgi:hypothetical protein